MVRPVNCCLLVSLPFRPSRLLAMRLGSHWRAWLVALATTELLAAWLLVRTLTALNRPAGMAAMAGTTPSGAGAALGLLLTTVLLGSVALRATHLSPRLPAYAGLGAFVVALLPVVRTASAGSHLVLMAQTMVLMVIAPALLMSALARRDSVPGLGPLAAGAYLVVLDVWHLPATHAAAMTNPGWDWIRIATTIAAGLLFWAAARTSLAPLIVVGAGSGLLGLALVAGPQPLFAMTGHSLGLTVLADQRLAGLLMMALDLTVLLPGIGRLAAAQNRGDHRWVA